MLVGQYVKREDGTVWQVAAILNSSMPHRASATLTPIEVTEYRLVRDGETRYVKAWGAEKAKDIGYPSEQLTPAGGEQ